MKNYPFYLLILLIYSVSISAFVDEMLPGIYVHIGKHLDVDEGYDGDICNFGFIVGDKAIAVIDSGGSYETALKLKKYIDEHYKKPIKYLINTHPHLDHIYGNIVFDSATIIGHQNLIKGVISRRDIYHRLNGKYLGKISAKQSPLVLPSELVPINQPLDIDLGGRKITLTAYREAHTEADLTVYDHQSKTLWTGDLVFRERTPVIDGNIHGFIEVLQGLANEDIQLVIPGHGKPASKKLSFDPILKYLVVLRDDVRKLIDEGQTLEYAIENAAASEKGKWLLFDIQNKRNVNMIYPMMEWE